MAKVGRPATETAKIDQEELVKLMGLHPSEQESADWFDVTIKTLQRFIRKQFDCSFVQLREKSFVRTRMSIKRAQIQLALKGNPTMLIWCGKQYLGQAEKVEQVVELEERIECNLNWADEQIAKDRSEAKEPDGGSEKDQRVEGAV